MAAARTKRRSKIVQTPSVAEAAATLSIIDSCNDPNLFGDWFIDRESWVSWFSFLRVLFALALNQADLALFQRCTGRTTPSPVGYLEATLIIGRRGGKSLILALIAAFLACFHDWSPYLTGGERGTIMVIAADRRQAGVIFKYLRGMLGIPLLADLITRETSDTIELSNGISIEIQTANFKTIRGRTVVAALCDELAFWTLEGSANPDSEIIGALRPAMATIPRALMLKASSPYSRRGTLWADFKRHFGKEDNSVLVWKADTRTMNPSVPQAVVDEAYENDPSAAAAEFGAEFRTDIESFISREVVDAAVVTGRFELPPVPGTDYFAFVDPSGGSSDSMTLAIGHREGDRGVLDAVREAKPPFSPEAVVLEFSELLKAYRISSVVGDRYAGEWPRERFRIHGIEYECSAKPKSDLYRDVLPLINSGQVELLDHPRMVGQLCALERRTARGGKDSIDHPPGGAHDDIINCVAGVLVRCAAPSYANGLGYLEYYRKLSEAVTNSKISQALVVMRAPVGFASSHYQTISGRTYLVADGLVEMSAEDAKAAEAQSWTKKELADA